MDRIAGEIMDEKIVTARETSLLCDGKSLSEVNRTSVD